MVALLALGAAVAVLRWLAANWWVLVVLALTAGAVAAAVLRARVLAARRLQLRAARLRLALSGPGGIDHMAPDAFEYAVRDLLQRDGCRAHKVGRANDQSVDVLAEDPLGRRWALQCKHKRDPLGGKPVGVGVLYALAGTYQRAHRAHVAVVVTNGSFSREAHRWGAEQGILLVDRNALARWAAGSRPLWDVLPRIPAPRGGHRH
ncbi:restriction endonuclease [Streptomyces sp. 1331.2]|uniref:restriction endonuclease n=1 Tax=Streptomyces sp. 1331.2 TaxID=1938835 RepID=UPI000BDBCBE9|nr:restriction endonuclease [Streptomyces sp. 1331.2]SOB88915.1 restriction system protein [Streptomyces sp. 1331.2]